MARAKLKTVEIQPAIPAQTEDRIYLELTRAEAETLRMMAGMVGVTGGGTRMAHIKTILKAFESVGVVRSGINAFTGGSMYFKAGV